MSPNWFSTAKVSPCFRTRVRGSRSASVASIRNWDSSSISSVSGTAIMAPLCRRRSVGVLRRAPGVVSAKFRHAALPRQNPVVDSQIVVNHPFGREALLESPPDRAPIELPGKRNRRHGRIEGIDDEPTQPILDDFGYGPATEGDHRRAVRHCLDQHETERLRPIYRKQQRQRIAEKRSLVGLTDLADELDQRILQQRHDRGLVISAIDRIDLGGNLQRQPDKTADSNGTYV